MMLRIRIVQRKTYNIAIIWQLVLTIVRGIPEFAFEICDERRHCRPDGSGRDRLIAEQNKRRKLAAAM